MSAQALPSLNIAQASALSLLPKGGTSPADKEAKAQAAAKEFEAVFLGESFEPMFKGVSVSGWKSEDDDGPGEGEEVYRSWLIQHYARAVVQRGGIGLADVVKKEMLKLQEVAS